MNGNVAPRTETLSALLLAALVSGCGREDDAWSLEPASHGAIERVHAFGSSWLASQPSEEDLRTLRAEGFRTVVNLRAREEWPFDEEAVVASLGLRYVHLPVTAEALSEADFERFEEILADSSAQPVFVHCRSASRVGALWAVYRMRRDGLSLEAALEEGRKVGLSGEALEKVVVDNAPP